MAWGNASQIRGHGFFMRISLFVACLPILLPAVEATRTANVAGITVTYLPAPLPQPMAPGPYQPSWESLRQYRFPAWFRDAKFGIWAHWGPQCMPEAGDWYGKNMYIQGKAQYDEHVRRFGHPSEFGFKDICHAWKAEHFDPEHLVEVYRQAGAKYFVAMANHHDNFDLWDSRYQPWNSVAIGPQQNLIGRWATAAHKAGLRFGVSIHASNTWNWFEVSQLSDHTGPKAGVPYDGVLTKADGKGTWWEGLDPQDLYAQNHRPSPMAGQKVELERQFPGEPVSVAFATKYCNRVHDLVDRYQPDLVYFDDYVLPLAMRTDSAYGLGLVAHIYNADQARHGGKNEAVINTKLLDETQRQCLVRDYEMAAPDTLEREPWQTDACIGHWHYARSSAPWSISSARTATSCSIFRCAAMGRWMTTKRRWSPGSATGWQ
jgi:alpha-L-fucosidase